MIKKLVIWSLWAIFSINGYASGLFEAAILYKSSTEKTIVLDIGDLQDFNEGLFGKILIQRGTLDRPTLYLVGTGRIVKAYPNKSIWVMGKNFIKNQILPNEKVLVVLESYITKGRTTNFKHTQIIFNKDEYSDEEDFLESNKNNVPDKLISHRHEYEASDDLLNEVKDPTSVAEYSTYDNFKVGGTTSESDEYQDEIKKLTYIVNDKYKIGDISRKEDLRLLHSDTNNLIKKINSQKYGLKNGLYYNSKKEPQMRDLTDKITVTNVYDLEKEKNNEKDVVDPKAIARIKAQGEMWSADMDDKTLRSYFVTSGLLKERMRREASIYELDGNEIQLTYFGNTNSHSYNPNNESMYQLKGYQIGFGYDYHFSRLSPDLKDWSLTFTIERGVNYYDINKANGRSEEGTYGLLFNYYFYNNPLTVSHFIWNIGMGLKVGTAQLTSDIGTQVYKYQILTLPSIQLMTKYRFRAGDLDEEHANVGASLNAGAVYETKSLRMLNVPSNNIYTTLDARDIKYFFGVSLFF
jgi:hypothetical protein